MTDVSLDAPILASKAGPSVGINLKISVTAAALLAVGTLALAATVSWRQVLSIFLAARWGLRFITRCSASPPPGAYSYPIGAALACAPR